MMCMCVCGCVFGRVLCTSDLKLGLVVVLNTVSQPRDFWVQKVEGHVRIRVSVLMSLRHAA